MSWLKKYDSFSKIQDDVRVKTAYGATSTILRVFVD
jgi:hypothetical protein